MELKRYQERVLREVRLYLDTLSAHQAAGVKHASLDALETVKDALGLIGNYQERKNASPKTCRLFALKFPQVVGKPCSLPKFWGPLTKPF